MFMILKFYNTQTNIKKTYHNLMYYAIYKITIYKYTFVIK